MAKFDLRLRIKAANLKEFGDELKKEVAKALSDIRNWGKIPKDIADEIRRNRRKIERELDDIRKRAAEKLADDIISGKDIVSPEQLVGLVKEGGARKEEARRGGLLGGLTGLISKESPLLLGIFSILGILEMIYNAVEKIMQMGATFSGYAQATLKMLKIIFELALKPIADVIGMMLMPVLALLLKYVIVPWSKITSGLNVSDTKKVLKETASNPLSWLVGGPVTLGIGEKIDNWIKKHLHLDTEPGKKYHVVELSFLPRLNTLKKIWGKIKGGLSWIGGKLRSSATWIWNKIKGIKLPSPNEIKKKIENFAKTLKDDFGKARTKVGEWLDKIKGGFKTIAGSITGLFTGDDSPVNKIVSGFAEIKNRIVGLLAKGGIIDTIVSTLGKIANAIKSAYDTVKSTLGGLISKAESAWESAKKTVGGVVSGIGSTIGGIVSGIGGAISNVLGWQIGGIIPRSGLYYLHGGELIVPTWKMMGVGGGDYYSITININANVRNDYDIKRIADEVERVLSDKMSRRGALR